MPKKETINRSLESLVKFFLLKPKQRENNYEKAENFLRKLSKNAILLLFNSKISDFIEDQDLLKTLPDNATIIEYVIHDMEQYKTQDIHINNNHLASEIRLIQANRDVKILNMIFNIFRNDQSNIRNLFSCDNKINHNLLLTAMESFYANDKEKNLQLIFSSFNKADIEYALGKQYSPSIGTYSTKSYIADKILDKLQNFQNSEKNKKEEKYNKIEDDQNSKIANDNIPSNFNIKSHCADNIDDIDNGDCRIL